MEIQFFEKPGCVGNARQKAILLAAGHTLRVENILEYPFTKKELELFFTGLPVTEWFNSSAPAIKSGEFSTGSVSRELALTAMLEDRLLIRRPLLRFGETRLAGFSIEILEKSGINCAPGPRLDILDKTDLESCPGDKIGMKCSEPRTLPAME